MAILAQSILRRSSFPPCAPNKLLSKIGGLIAGMVFASSLAALPVQAAPSEHELKAIFLFQFSQFVTWPEGAFAHPGDPFVIGLLGTNLYGSVLSDLVRNEKAAGRPIVVRHLRQPLEARSCQIVFIAPDAINEWRSATLGTLPILTVGESESFTQSGGMIQFVLQRNRVRLWVNLKAAEEMRLKISSRLLRVADKVEKPSP